VAVDCGRACTAQRHHGLRQAKSQASGRLSDRADTRADRAGRAVARHARPRRGPGQSCRKPTAQSRVRSRRPRRSPMRSMMVVSACCSSATRPLIAAVTRCRSGSRTSSACPASPGSSGWSSRAMGTGLHHRQPGVPRRRGGLRAAAARCGQRQKRGSTCRGTPRCQGGWCGGLSRTRQPRHCWLRWRPRYGGRNACRRPA
jgi:hypothetical protein